MTKEGRVEPVVGLLFAGMLFFTGILLLVVHFNPNDGQTFQVISNILSGFTGAFFMRIKSSQPGSTLTPAPPDQTVTATVGPTVTS